MKVVFVSNYLNHHSLPLCRALSSLNDDFNFIATSETNGIGYTLCKEQDFVMKYYSASDHNKCLKAIIDADVVIFGDCPSELIAVRMEFNKLSFLYSERFLKKGEWRRFIPRTRKKIIEKVVKYKNSQMFVLCASSYLPKDLSYFRFPLEKCYKWGYFPELENYDVESILTEKQSHTIVRLFWAARMIPLKHPEIIIKLAKELHDNQVDFELKIAGSGELENKIYQMIVRIGLCEKVKMLGELSPVETREMMFKSDIFLFTSDYHEGWGAVVNEAMNAGCAVVCSDAVGSAKYLINNGVNGYYYQYGNYRDFYQKVLKLINDIKHRENMCREATMTIKNNWNASTAAERLTKCAETLLNNKDISMLYLEGPCSLATTQKEKRGD